VAAAFLTPEERAELLAGSGYTSSSL